MMFMSKAFCKLEIIRFQEGFIPGFFRSLGTKVALIFQEGLWMCHLSLEWRDMCILVLVSHLPRQKRFKKGGTVQLCQMLQQGPEDQENCQRDFTTRRSVPEQPPWNGGEGGEAHCVSSCLRGWSLVRAGPGSSRVSQEEDLVVYQCVVVYVLLFQYSLGSDLALDRLALSVREIEYRTCPV